MGLFSRFIILFYVSAHKYHGAAEEGRGPLYGTCSLLPCSCGFGESRSVPQVFKAVFSYLHPVNTEPNLNEAEGEGRVGISAKNKLGRQHVPRP